MDFKEFLFKETAQAFINLVNITAKKDALFFKTSIFPSPAFIYLIKAVCISTLLRSGMLW